MTTFAMLNGVELGMIGMVLSLMLVVSAFWIWALVHCARRVSAGESGLVGWLIAICLLHLVGALGYVIFARRQTHLQVYPAN